MRRKPLFLLFLATSSVIVSSPEAKIRAKGWEFGVAATQIDAEASIPVDNGMGGTLTFGYMFSEKLEAEIFITKNSTSHGDVPALDDLVVERVAFPTCRANLTTTASDAECFQGVVTGIAPEFEDGDDFLRGFAQVTANFLVDRETRTKPYLSGGVGVVSETREAFPYSATYQTTAPDNTLCPDGTEGPDGDNLRETCTYTQTGDNPERFDSAFLITLGAGARTFFSDWFGVRYEARYLRHDTFVEGQNEWLVTVGATFVLGGEK